MKSFKLNVLLVLTGITSMVISSKAQTTLLWSETAGTGASTQKSFVATDLLGNIYMACAVNGTYGLDWKVSSWRPDSVSRWTYTYNGSGNVDDVPSAIIVDSAFSVFVSGTTRSSGSNDLRIIKLDSAGNLKWGTNYNRTGSAHDVATGMALWGNRVYVCGHSQQSTSNYDYTVLKYDTAGTLLWSRHANGTGSGDDYTTAIAVKTGGSDIFVTGNAVTNATGSPRDMMTLRYSNDGTLQWTKYYGNTTGQHDYGNAIAINYSGDIIVTGQSYVTSTNSNLTTIKYSGSSGAQAWAASYAGTYGGHDAAYSVVIDPDNYFYVTGYTQVGSSNTDYVTVKYKGNGSVTWAQTYNGPGNGADEACKVIHDGDDVVITGKSTGSGTGLDVCIISMVKSSGSVNWTTRINESGSTGDWGVSLCRDEMGNICVGGVSQTSGSSFVNIVFKLNQSAKNAAAIKAHMEMLSYAALALVNDTACKRVLYDDVNLCVDSFYKAVLNEYLAKCDQQSIAARTLMRSAIVSHYGWTSGYHWEKIINHRIYKGKSRRPAMIYIPGFETFTRSGFISTTSQVAFSHGEMAFPIMSPSEDAGYYEDDFLAIPTLTIVAQPPAWWTKSPPVFRFCYGKLAASTSSHCSTCGNQIALDGLATGTNCSSSLMGHEVGIRIGSGFDTDCNIYPPGFDYCIDVTDMEDGPATYPQFAMLYAMPGYIFYERIGQSASTINVRKVQYPIYDVDSNRFAQAMTLCNDWKFDFNDYHGSTGYTELYALSWGGVYRISRPGADQRPLYFAFPFAGYLRYGDGPDMNIYYGATDLYPATCSNGTHAIEEDYFLGGCAICDETQYVFGLTQNQAADILVTTDYQAISSYWMDNAITVGFCNNSEIVDPANHKTFYASTSPTTCSPSTYNPVSMTPICSQVLLSNGQYQVRKNFVGDSTYAPGRNLLIHVQARYSNGEVINECQQITLASTSTSMANVTVEIRGGINDYSAVYTNYRIDIYKLP